MVNRLFQLPPDLPTRCGSWLGANLKVKGHTEILQGYRPVRYPLLFAPRQLW